MKEGTCFLFLYILLEKYSNTVFYPPVIGVAHFVYEQNSTSFNIFEYHVHC